MLFGRMSTCKSTVAALIVRGLKCVIDNSIEFALGYIRSTSSLMMKGGGEGGGWGMDKTNQSHDYGSGVHLTVRASRFTPIGVV